MSGPAVAMAVATEAPRVAASTRLAELFDAHHQRLYRLARRLAQAHDEARDLVQETFLHAARAPGSIPCGAAQEEAWLVRVLINIARDRWRKAATRRRLTPLAVSSPSCSNAEDAAVARTTIWRALEALPPRRRAIVVLYELEGTAIPAIAKLLGVTAVTVRWHLSRGRRELASFLGATREKQ
jgi:RNA polymerase sigma-70 factor (ECF subfamily)